MTDHPTKDASDFDEYAGSYDRDLALGLAATGEDRNYFARRRVEWLRRCLDRMQFAAGRTIEFGCGTGSNVPFLIELAGATSVVGIDTSGRSLEVARSTFGSLKAQFYASGDYEAQGSADLVFCNGVFHHIPPPDRAATVEYLYRCLRPGGLLALWENNPWNPGTRYVMSRIPFDRDAITLSPPESRRLVRAAGFEVLRTDCLFIFPHFLRWLRALEPHLSALPIGGQYELLCRRRLE
ncbi:MAG: methyltransferase [Candidatus Binatus sp.]|uniref:class I SAM-dependent methyltransferase n=1 Tax=Candidatus Binatus sp. TaxID=2811406 RepID=UPI003C70DADA